MAQFDWRNPDFSVQLLNGELITDNRPVGYGVLKHNTTTKSRGSSKNKKSGSKKSVKSVRNPGGNYNGSYGKGVYKRSAQINPETYVDDLEEFLDRQGRIETIKSEGARRINEYNQAQKEVNDRLALLTNSPINGQPLTLLDAQELARWYGLPTFRYNGVSHETLFNDGDVIMDTRGYVLGPATNIWQHKPQQNRMNYDGMSFSKAFAAARKAGLDQFNWRGKDYTTELANSKKSRNKPAKASSTVPAPGLLDMEPMDAHLRLSEDVNPDLAPYRDLDARITHDPYNPGGNNVPYTFVNPEGVISQMGYGGWLLPM